MEHNYDQLIQAKQQTAEIYEKVLEQHGFEMNRIEKAYRSTPL